MKELKGDDLSTELSRQRNPIRQLLQNLISIMANSGDSMIVVPILAGLASGDAVNAPDVTEAPVYSISLPLLDQSVAIDIVIQAFANHSWGRFWQLSFHWRMLIIDMGGLPRALEILVKVARTQLDTITSSSTPLDLKGTVRWLRSKVHDVLLEHYPNTSKISAALEAFILRGDLVPTRGISYVVDREFIVPGGEKVGPLIDKGIVWPRYFVGLERSYCVLQRPLVFFDLETPGMVGILELLKDPSWQHFEEFIAEYSSFRLNLFRGQAVSFEDFHQFASFPRDSSVAHLKMAIPSTQSAVAQSSQQFPNTTALTGKAGPIKWNNDLNIVVMNGVSAPFADVFSLHAIEGRKKKLLDAKQCKMGYDSQSDQSFISKFPSEFAKVEEGAKTLRKYDFALGLFLTRPVSQQFIGDVQSPQKNVYVVNVSDDQSFYFSVFADHVRAFSAAGLFPFFCFFSFFSNFWVAIGTLVNCANVEGLKSLKGIGASMACQILDARGDRPFKDIDDLFTRAKISSPKAQAALSKIPWVFK